MQWSEAYMNLNRPVDPQVLRQLAWHLERGGQYQKLYALLLDSPSWLEKKLSHFGSNDSYVEDLQIALKTLPVISDPQQALICAQLHVARQVARTAGELYTDTDFQTLTWLGQEQLAVAYASARGDTIARFEGLLAIWESQLERGSTDRLLLFKIFDTSHLIGDTLRRISASIGVAERLAKLGEREVAGNLFISLFDELRDRGGISVTFTVTNRETLIISSDNELLREQMFVECADRELSQYRVERQLIGAMIRSDYLEEAFQSIAILDSGLVRIELWCILYQHCEVQSLKEQGALASQLAWSKIRELKIPAVRALANSFLMPLSKKSAEALQMVRANLVEVSERAAESIKLANSFELGRVKLVDKINVIQDIHNLCVAALALDQSGEHTMAEWAVSIASDLALTINPPAEDDPDIILGETPLIYVEQWFGGERIESIACYGRRDDALAEVAVTFASIARLERAKSVLSEIRHEMVYAAVAHRLSPVLISAGLTDQAAEIASKAISLQLVKTQDGVDVVFVTGYNQKVYQSSGSSTETHFAEQLLEAFLQSKTVDECLLFIDETTRMLGTKEQRKSTERASVLNSAEHQRATLIRQIARYCAREGLLSRAKELLLMAHRIDSASVDSEQRPRTILALMEAFATTGNLGIAERLLRHLKDRQFLVKAHQLLARAEAREETENGIIRARNRLFVKARNVLSRYVIEDPYERAESLRMIAKELAAMGCVDELVTTMVEAQIESESIDSPEYRSDALRLWAETAHELGYGAIVDEVFEAAIESARRVFPRYASVYLYAVLGESLDRTGRSDWADALFAMATHEIMLRYPRSHSSDAALLIPALAKTKRFDLAISLISAMSEDSRYSEKMYNMLELVAWKMVSAGLYGDASVLLLAITDPNVAADGYCTVAREAAKNGNSRYAEKAYETALRHSEKIADSYRKDTVLARLAASCIENDQSQRAAVLLGSISSSVVKEWALKVMSTHAMTRGDVVMGLEKWNASCSEALLADLADWSNVFAKIGESVPRLVLINALRIVGWYTPKWHEVYSKLSEM
jgi:tetratricopeptide (TPR) repeat protein